MSSRNRTLAFAFVGLLAIVGALAIRQRSTSAYLRSRQQLKLYQERQKLREQMEAEASAEQRRIALLEKAVLARPSDVKLRWMLADHYQRVKLIDKGRDQLAAIHRLEPKNDLALVGLGNADLALHRFADAEKECREVVARSPKSVDGWAGLAGALYHQGRFREAASASLSACRLEPKDFGNRFTLGMSALHYALEFPAGDPQVEQLGLAKSIFASLSKEEPQNADVLHNLGRSAFLLRDKKTSLDALGRAYALAPDRPAVAQDYIQALLSTGDHAAALRIAGESVKRIPDIGALHDTYGTLLGESHDPAVQRRAVDEALAATRLEPRNERYLDDLGTQYLRAGDLASARKAYEQSLLLNENRSKPYQQLAGIYTRLGDTPRATAAARMAARMVANEQKLRQIQELSSKYDDDVGLLIILADRYRELKMAGAARDTYLKVLRLDPGNAPAKAGLALITAPQKVAQRTAR